jgi:hypothetical protein
MMYQTRIRGVSELCERRSGAAQRAARGNGPWKCNGAFPVYIPRSRPEIPAPVSTAVTVEDAVPGKTDG